MRLRRYLPFAVISVLFFVISINVNVQVQVQGDAVDVSQDFQKQEQLYFIGNKVTNFDPETGLGSLEWDRYWRQFNLSFNKLDRGFAKARNTDFPGTEYDTD